MGDTMTFPASVEEFMEQYKMTDTEHVYSNGTEYVPIYRMKQWFENCRHQQLPTIDAVPVVRCDSCVLEGNCFAESHFRFAGIKNPFCCAGKRKEGAD